MRISDWSSDVFSSDLSHDSPAFVHDSYSSPVVLVGLPAWRISASCGLPVKICCAALPTDSGISPVSSSRMKGNWLCSPDSARPMASGFASFANDRADRYHVSGCRSEAHTSELQSLMRISYAVFCLKKKN